MTDKKSKGNGRNNSRSGASFTMTILRERLARKATATGGPPGLKPVPCSSGICAGVAPRLPPSWASGGPLVSGSLILGGQEVFDLLDDYVSGYVADGFGQGELLGAGLDAVLGEAALLDAAVAGEGAEALLFEDFA
jgi:hypothetical protein